jgi:hypothetical protein
MTLQEDIIDVVIKVMLPLEEVSERAKEIISKLIIPLPGKSEVELSDNKARQMLGALLDSMNYKAPSCHCGRITDLRSDDRLNLIIDTATGLAFGCWRWHQGQVQSILDMWPAQEFYRAASRENPRNWFERWQAAGGRVFQFTGKESYPATPNYKGRMIALKNDTIWETVSVFGLPFRPFDFQSGMDIRDVTRHEAIELGLIESNQRIQPIVLPPSDEFKKQLAARLRQNLAKLEDDVHQRLSNPLVYGTGEDLLDIAEEKIEELGALTFEQCHEIKSLVEKAIEKGFNDEDDRLATAHKFLVKIYELLQEPEKAEANREKYVEYADSSSLLDDAKE